MKKRLVLAGGILAIGIVTAIIWWLQRPQHAAPSKSDTVTSTTPATAKTTALSTVNLPNTSPIPAVDGDYTDSSHLWVLVSKNHPLVDTNYAPDDLAVPAVAVNTAKSIEEQSLRKIIHEPVIALFAAAKTAGYDLFVASGFRSYGLQKTYFDNYARLSGEAEANKYSARPGQSEHQTGLALDISLASRDCYLETCFGDTAAGKWLAAHAHEYGFVLRYPADKVEITQYQYEPWHFRYVGNDLARALHESELTLDEAREFF